MISVSHEGDFPLTCRKELLDQTKLIALWGEDTLQNGLASLLKHKPGQVQRSVCSLAC